ncbi:hypothetical protein [Paracoccus sp. MKU1]|uniref:hypothetical protein n=1 Tax=Paracoccus sp. MKU1 TaxID=1745182 RepID=UPI00128F6352|nr:hypothetical protein [Paracoccus sp. MKU1]
MRAKDASNEAWLGDLDKTPQRLALAIALDLITFVKNIEIEEFFKPFTHGPVREIQNVATTTVKYLVEGDSVLRRQPACSTEYFRLLIGIWSGALHHSSR